MPVDREVSRLLRGLAGGSSALLAEVGRSPIEEDADVVSAGRTRSIWLVREKERPPFFDYQDDLASRMAEMLSVGGTGLLSLPTGAGKTRTAIGALLEARKRDPRIRICWLAPTYELLEQAWSTCVELWKMFGSAPDMRISMAGDPDPGTDLWLTTPQAMASRIRRGARLGTWEGIIVDEAHQMAAPTFRAAIESLRGGGSTRSLVGLSATPGRAREEENDVLIELFGASLLTSRLLGIHPVEALQRRGVLCELRFKMLSKREPSSLDEIERLKVILRACRYLARRARRVLVFTSSVAAAQALSIALTEKGISASWVSGSLGSDERLARISDFATGVTQILANQRLLATGYDCPAVSDVVIEAKISSPILFEQIVGRVARGPLTGGARIGTVWQFEDHLQLHGLPQSYYRYRDYDWV